MVWYIWRPSTYHSRGYKPNPDAREQRGIVTPGFGTGRVSIRPYRRGGSFRAGFNALLLHVRVGVSNAKTPLGSIQAGSNGAVFQVLRYVRSEHCSLIRIIA